MSPAYDDRPESYGAYISTNALKASIVVITPCPWNMPSRFVAGRSPTANRLEAKIVDLAAFFLSSFRNTWF